MPPPPPPPQTPPYLTILMTERGRHYVCSILASPMPPPSPTTPQYLTTCILMKERGGAIIFCRILEVPQPPPPPQCSPSPDATILNNLNDREGALLCLQDFSATNAPPPTTPRYLTILMTGRGAPLYFVGFWSPPPPPQKSQYFNYLDDRERGGANCDIL